MSLNREKHMTKTQSQHTSVLCPACSRLATTRSNTSSFQVSKVDCLEQRVQEANKNQPAGAAELQAS